tara:strand:- start:143 stop:754 length:612 start_codon:yes stop_codon:yes gene_type:complete
MTLHIEPEPDIPTKATPIQHELDDLQDRTEAAAETVNFLSEHGLQVDINSEAKDTASALTTAYAEDPKKTSSVATTKRVARMTPAEIVLANDMLKKFSHRVVEDAADVRNFVTNKLILESDNVDSRIRVRALELLGKIGDVGLFTEKTEVTVTHQSTDELREQLREKLSRMVEVIDDIDYEDVTDDGPIDVDKELGLSNVESN